MSNKKVVKSAVCIIPPTELWDDIQDLRRESDKAYARWPPHINLLYPFVPVEEFAEVAPKLAKAVESISPFSVTFENFSSFPHGTIFCDPQTKIEKTINTLQSALESAVPYCNDQSAKQEGFHAHLTVGQVLAGDTAENVITNTLKFWSPIQFNVDRVYLIARTGDEPFKIHYQVFLKDGRAEPVNIPYTIKKTATEGDKDNSKDTDSEPGTARTGVQVGPSHARLVLDVPAPLVGVAATAQQRQLLFVVDISGSMCASYHQVVSAVKYMLDTQPAVEPLFIVFDHTSRVASAQEVMSLRANGGTLFSGAVREITKLLDKNVVDEKLELSIVFMTDGQDGDKSQLPTAISSLKASINKRKKKVVVHTIAFGGSADFNFLNTIRAIGPEEGMMREVKGSNLQTSFSEIFDFLDITKTFRLVLGTGPGQVVKDVEGEMKKIGFEDYVSLDIVYNKSSEEFALLQGKDSISAELGDHKVELPKLEPDVFFNLRGIESMEILNQEQLAEAQTMLQNTNALKGPKAQRQEAVEMKTEIQEQLNKFYQAFADIARGGAYGSTSILQSLRYDFKFNKSRRVRTMNQRATKNASVFAKIEKMLAALKLSDEELAAFSDLDYTCPLSGDSIYEVMSGSKDDVMMFSLRVTRPEHAIDAPTGVQVNDIMSGTYSNYAFQQSMAFALRKGNATQAHGGFSENNAENVGFFKGPDGKFMNACLPLYINEHHWKRVELQLEPLLGYFFTLDPLGFKGDQYLALFMILGNMLSLRSSGAFKSEWADWLIDDFRKLCTAIKPKVIKYLQSGFYANGLLKEDPLIAFMNSPAGRTKQVLQNIMVIVGWADVSEGYDKEKFKLAFVEEVWRRNFSTFYKAQPREIVMTTIEKLIYGPPEDSDPSKQLEGLVSKKLNRNDKEFKLWADFKLYNQWTDELAQIDTKEGPEIEGTLAPDTGYTSRKTVDYETHKDFIKGVVNSELAKINDVNKFFEKYTDGAILGGDKMDTRVQWILVLQALQYCSNDLVNSGVSSGSYKNSLNYLDKPDEILEAQHVFFDTHRKQNWEAFIRDKNTLITAEQIVATKDIWAFIGRMMKSCPTRGGAVFDAVVSYLHSPPSNIVTVPLLNKKVEIIFTGKFKKDGEIDGIAVHAEGTAWVHCTQDNAKKFKAVMGEEVFSLMEAQLHGHWGWVYRPSDTPNRHGHCNSNPNPLLAKDFSGFGV